MIERTPSLLPSDAELSRCNPLPRSRRGGDPTQVVRPEAHLIFGHTGDGFLPYCRCQRYPNFGGALKKWGIERSHKLGLAALSDWLIISPDKKR